jgi:hypothetical protein
MPIGAARRVQTRRGLFPTVAVRQSTEAVCGSFIWTLSKSFRNSVSSPEPFVAGGNIAKRKPLMLDSTGRFKAALAASVRSRATEVAKINHGASEPV